jgi:hypothetical protein
MSRAVIHRARLERRAGRFAWSWLYSVSIDGGPRVEHGTHLGAAVSWAKQRAAYVCKAWGRSGALP